MAIYECIGNMPKACPYVMAFTLWCLRYGVVGFVEFVEFVELRANGAHYNIKRSRFLLVGEPALWGGYALFGGVFVVVDYDELADFGADSQFACCSHE